MPPTFLTIPPELRDLVYAALFADLTITHSHSICSSISLPSNRTSLLRTSRQLYHEVSPYLASSCILQFSSTETMLETLMSLSDVTLRRLRRMKVMAFPFPMYTDRGMRYYRTYAFYNALSLLPGLQLRQLEVEDTLADSWTQGEVGKLVQCDGWRELVFVSRNRGLEEGVEELDESIKTKNGVESGASVSMEVREEGKEVRVVARRGVNYTQQDMDGARCQEVADRKSWRETKEKGVFPVDWEPWCYDEMERKGWLYGGWSKRMKLAVQALG